MAVRSVPPLYLSLGDGSFVFTFHHIQCQPKGVNLELVQGRVDRIVMGLKRSIHEGRVNKQMMLSLAEQLQWLWVVKGEMSVN